MFEVEVNGLVLSCMPGIKVGFCFLEMHDVKKKCIKESYLMFAILCCMMLMAGSSSLSLSDDTLLVTTVITNHYLICMMKPWVTEPLFTLLQINPTTHPAESEYIFDMRCEVYRVSQ